MMPNPAIGAIRGGDFDFAMAFVFIACLILLNMTAELADKILARRNSKR